MLAAAPPTFGELLRQHRVAAGLTQEMLAERAGLSVHGVQKLERGATHPYRDTAQRLEQALQLAPDDQARFRATVQPVRRHAAVQTPPKAGRPSHNLPAGVTSFIGRAQELVEISRRLSDTRLLTLTGVGGCGKTRLALELARSVLELYPHGVWLVELGPLADPALVAQRVGTVLGIRETAEQPIGVALANALRTRVMLLVLDNCEHLLDACAQLVEPLLQACADLRIVATSREAIGISGEVAWRVPSLEQTPAIQLFVERARAAQPHFVLSDRNSAAVAQICRRLDGLPLALELAAARIDALAPEQIALRLDQRFRLLTDGSRTALPRQQTLAATLDWSYNLLSKSERRFFERLAVFSGGWTLEAAEAVCPAPGLAGEDVLDLLTHLTRKSLVIAEESTNGTERYRLLETVRDYARDKLDTRGAAEMRALRERHATHYSELAKRFDLSGEMARPAWAVAGGANPSEHMQLVDTELDNVRAALAWWLEARQPAQGLGLRNALGLFLVWRGLYAEARKWGEALLELESATGGASLRERAAALFGVGLMASRQGDYQHSRTAFEASAAICRQLQDGMMLPYVLSMLGLDLWLMGEWEQASITLEDDRRLLDEVRDRGEQWLGCAAQVDRNRGMIARSRQQYERAAALFQQSISYARALGPIGAYPLVRALSRLGRVAHLQGDGEQARLLFREALELMRAYLLAGHSLADCLDWLAAVECAAGKPDRAAHLFGAAEAQWLASGAVRYAPDRSAYEHDLGSVRAQLDPKTFAGAWAEGHALRADEAITLALEDNTHKNH
jgi:non-specific serine/threonine protein kinase